MSIYSGTALVQTAMPTPVFNSGDFERIFYGKRGSLDVDEKGHIRSLEFVALPATVFHVLETQGEILSVKTKIYPSDQKLFIDGRMTTDLSTDMPKRKLPPKSVVLQRLKEYPFRPYLWGGNCTEGIENIEQFYPIRRELSAEERWRHYFRGVDCSGLLYAVCEGLVPRNTRELMHFGREVETPEPLDLIVWPGHVVIVIDEGLVIESLEGVGVRRMPYRERMNEIKQANYPFSLRRFL